MNSIQQQAKFELLEDKLLGEGSFGKVYQCRWHGIPAAAKLFNVLEDDVGSTVTQEIEMIKNLRNDYIIQFFGTIHYGNRLYLITSFAENGTLYQALSRHKLPHEHKQGVITGLIRGMQFLKSNNVIHRDFKSPNVLLDSNYAPKICDFGLALLKMTSATNVKTSTAAAIVGTMRWMAPELLGLNPRYSFASDVYALGIIIWEILTEKAPYSAIIDVVTIMALIKNGTHEEIPDHIPEHYKTIIASCWEFDPKKRMTVEEINRVNDEALPRVDAASDGVIYEDDVSDSILAINNISVSFSLQGRSTGSTAVTTGIATADSTAVTTAVTSAKRWPVVFAEALDQYLKTTSNRDDKKDHLAAIVDRHGESLIQWIKAAARERNIAAIIVLGEMHYYGCGVPQDDQAAFDQFYTAAMKEVSDLNGSQNRRLSTETAKQRIGRAQCNLGLMYEEGRGVPQNNDKAVEWYTKAAVQGISEAQFNLGWLYLDGRGVPQSDDKAFEWYMKAAQQNYASAQYNLGWMYETGRGIPLSITRSVEWYTRSAEQGYAVAQNKLGILYMDGLGVPQSSLTAAEWYAKAAKQGNVDAEYNLAGMYRSGIGTSQDDYKAVEWYTKAAEQNDMDAQYKLGEMYRSGIGAPKDDILAIEWYTKAAEQGEVNAQHDLGLMYQNGEGVPQNESKATEWFTKAAEQGHLEAQYKLGLMYEQGQGVSQSDEKAAEWYTSAAEQGQADAQVKLGWMYEEGRGVQKMDEKAAEWYTRAAEQGNADGQVNLGWMYETGRGVPQSDYEATEWYTQAAEQGNASAQFRLGRMHQNGRGVSQSYDKAVEWYTKATEQRLDSSTPFETDTP